MTKKEIFKEIFSKFPQKVDINEAKELFNERKKRPLTQEEAKISRLYGKFMSKYKKAMLKLQAEKKWQEQISLKEKSFEKLRNKISKAKKLFCLDIETFERKNDKITEIGISIFTPENSELINYHYIVSENIHHRNGKFVPDNKENFLHGNSIILPLEDIVKEVNLLVQDTTYLVGHAFSNDKFFLEKCGMTKFPEVIDTQKVAKLFFEDKRNIGLELLSEQLELSPSFLHNAGNDTYMTMKSLFKLLNI